MTTGLTEERYEDGQKKLEGFLMNGEKEGMWKEWYPDGQLRTLAVYKEGQPANGWTFKSWHPNGTLQTEQCFSHNLMIEQIDYDGQGTRISHKIWNNRLRQLVDKPKQTEVIHLNVFSSCAHMGHLMAMMPRIASYIKASYNEDEFRAAYNAFQDSGEQEATWTLRGERMTVTVLWELHEGYYFWHCSAPDEETYWAARHYLEELEGEVKGRR
ncbi:MAG TPA: hypothetical protein VGB46_04985 [Flavisolibacter sp.]|jgi:hypothetical protein